MADDEYNVGKVALAVIAGIFFGGVGTGVAFPTLPLLDDVLGISAVMLGVILSANRVSRLVMNTPAGQIIDSMGARRPMIAGLFVQGFAPFGYVAGLHTPRGVFVTLPLFGEVSNPSVVFTLSRLFWGVGSAFVFIGAFAIITHITTQSNRGKWTGYMRGGQSLGFPTGLVVGGIMTDVFDIQTAFLTAGGLTMFAAVVAFFVIPDVRSSGSGRAGLLELPAVIRNEPRVIPIGVGNFTVRFLFGGVLLTTLVKYADAYTIDFSLLSAAGVSGVVMGAGILTSSGTTVISGRVSDLLENRVLITVPAFLFLALGFGALAYLPSFFGILGSVILIGVGMGGSVPVLLAYLGDISSSDDLGKMGGVYNVFGDIGLSLGPLLAVPAVTNWFGYRTTYVACSLLVVACMVVVNIPLVRD
ncbi:MAG: MFS transporter [Halobacteria archaeon]|nr:MFS transporter [Halobacteria archaeon]